MNARPIPWLRALLGALVAEVLQVLAAFVWVAIYSHVLAPGRPVADYQAHAQTAGPWVAIIAGLPVFYAASRWIARSLRGALALYGIFLALDLGLLVALGAPVAAGVLALFGVSYATKLLACVFGGRHAEGRADTAAR